MNENEKILESINNIKTQIEDTKSKMEKARRLSILSIVSSIILFIIFGVLMALFFTVVKHKACLIISIISLVIGFVVLQIGIVNIILVKYMYTQKINALLSATELIKKEINK